MSALIRIGCWVFETEGFCLVVERNRRLAFFYGGAVGNAYGVQLEQLRLFLEETE